jgi:hypothetical protein
MNIVKNFLNNVHFRAKLMIIQLTDYKKYPKKPAPSVTKYFAMMIHPLLSE